MKQDKDWIDVMRSSLREAETPPPADGWARLERELGTVPAPRVPAWRIHWPRIAAAAAVVICIAAGEYLWHADTSLKGLDGNVITTTADSGTTAESEAPITNAITAELRPEVIAQHIPAKPSRTEIRVIVPVVPEDSEVQQPAVEPEGPQAEELREQPSGEPERKTAARSTQRPQERAAYGDDFVAYTPPRKKASFSVYGGGAVTGGSAVGIGTRLPASMSDAPLTSGKPVDGSISLMRQYDYRQGEFRHHQPLSFGFSVRKEFAHGLSLESGVNYTLLRSDVTLVPGSDDISQKLHFIGVPLRVNWQFLERGRFSLYMGAGGMIEKCVSAKFGGKALDEPGVQWSVLGAAGAQYRLGGMVGLYFEPEVSYYFTETELRTSRTDSPLNLTLRLGVRLSF